MPEQALAHSGELWRLSGTCAGHQHIFAQLRRSASIGAHMPFTPPHMLASHPGLKIVVHPAGFAIPTTSSFFLGGLYSLYHFGLLVRWFEVLHHALLSKSFWTGAQELRITVMGIRVPHLVLSPRSRPHPSSRQFSWCISSPRST